MSAVIFDLDDTLVVTGHLREIRDQSLWKFITKTEIAKIKPFPGIPELLALLRSRGCKIAIVTTAPRWYAEQIIEALSLPCDAIVAAGEVKYGKPDVAPSRLALDLLGQTDASTAFVVGDRCIDIISGNRVCDWTIGAVWGTKNIRDLMLSYPKFLATVPSEVGDVICGVLDGKPLEPYEWGKTTPAKLWLNPPGWDRRMHLTDAGISYRFSRVYRGKQPSWTDNQIWIFKTKNANQWRYKRRAAALFAGELLDAIPEGSWIMFVLPSKLKGTEGYDNRWEILADELESKRGKRNFKICQAIELTTGSVAAHDQSADSADRDPTVIKSRLGWVGGIPQDASDVVVIDDVLTKGGHMRAYHDVVRRHCPTARIHLLAWAVFSSKPWHECPYGSLLF
jgi:FMN phosphatase YigB (HAD superfamily)